MENKMYIKLRKNEFDYLIKHYKFADLISICLQNQNFIKVYVDVNIAENIREWALDELESKGFDEEYNLNPDGKILQSLVDLFYA